MQNHTQAPWRFIKGEQSNGIDNQEILGDIRSNDDYSVAAIWKDAGDEDGQEISLTNAALIARAPELLSQLNVAKEENERLKKHSAIANEKQMQMQERIDFQKECLEAAARERHSVVDSLKAEADALRREVEELKVKWEDSQLTQNLEQEIVNISDEDALIVYDIIGGPSISNEAKIANVKDLLTTNKFYVLQTNIPGGTWKKVFDLLETNGYKVP